MNSILRACGFAAAGLGCLGAVAFADPSIAAIKGGQAQASAIDAHSLATMTDTVMEMADAATPRPRTLDEVVPADYRAEIKNEEQECLATAVYFEARSEPIRGQFAVADVVLNRAASGKYPTSICGVVKQPWQFSFVEKGGIFPTADRDSKAWRKAVAIADIALAGLSETVQRDVLWYHADYVAPVWRKSMTREDKIGLHIFYS